jgi:hypothetical protein
MDPHFKDSYFFKEACDGVAHQGWFPKIDTAAKLLKIAISWGLAIPRNSDLKITSSSDASSSESVYFREYSIHTKT